MSSVFWQHVRALTLKECRQIARDKSSIILGLILPFVLIVLFGQGIRFDVKDVRLAVADLERSEASANIAGTLAANKTFLVDRVQSRREAMALLERFEAEAVVILDRAKPGDPVEVLVDGIGAPRAAMAEQAVKRVIVEALARQQAREADTVGNIPGTFVNVLPRIWFNESLESTRYLIPGLCVIILNMAGTMLTSLVVAREWERGTMEALMATPVSRAAILLSKTIPYFVIAMAGWTVCLLTAVFVYGVPFRGSVAAMLAGTVLYLLFSLGMGLVLSAATRSQFVSCQGALFLSFLPAVFLSGFIFDLRSMHPLASAVAHIFPAVYYLDILKVSFLTAGMEELLVKNLLILSLYAGFFMLLAYRLLAKRVRA